MENKKKSTFSERLRQTMEDQGLNQAQLAKKAGISASSISDWLNEKYEAKQDKIDLMARTLKVSPTYLMGYDVDKEVRLEDIPGIIPIHKVKLARIPILGQIACGKPAYYEEVIDDYFYTEKSTINADFILKADGRSMVDANIDDGDLVFFKATPQVENGAIAAVAIDGAATLKRYYKTDSQIILQPYNDSEPTIVINADEEHDIRIIGEKVAILKMGNK